MDLLIQVQHQLFWTRDFQHCQLVPLPLVRLAQLESVQIVAKVDVEWQWNYLELEFDVGFCWWKQLTPELMRCHRLPRKCRQDRRSGWNWKLKMKIKNQVFGNFQFKSSRGIIGQRQRWTLQWSIRMSCRGRTSIWRDRTLLMLLKNMIKTHYVTGLVGHLLRHRLRSFHVFVLVLRASSLLERVQILTVFKRVAS